MTDTTKAENALADGLGLLKGSKAIAEFIGISQRDVLRHTHKGELPCFEVGNALRASPDSLRAWVAEQEMKAQLNRLRA